jgi:hypothetical protein
MSSNKLVKLLHLVSWFIWIVWWYIDLRKSNYCFLSQGRKIFSVLLNVFASENSYSLLLMLIMLYIFFKLFIPCISSAYEMKNQQMSLYQFYSYIDGSLNVSGLQAHPQESSHSCSHNHWFSGCTVRAACSVYKERGPNGTPLNGTPLNQWLCEQLCELSWGWACRPETCRDPSIYE